MPEGKGTDATLEELLLASVVLQLADREERIAATEPTRSEILLVDAGLSLSTVARLTGKNYETVKAAVRRARVKAVPRRAGKT
jgi:DNA-directed RNA polymerase specialized sigma24 family protein